MKKQILIFMACAAFLAPPSGFCMEIEDQDNRSPMQRVLNTPEIGVKILSYLHVPGGYTLRLMADTEDVSQIKYGELGVFCENEEQLYFKISNKEKKQIISLPGEQNFKYDSSGRSKPDYSHGINEEDFNRILGATSTIMSVENFNSIEYRWPCCKSALFGFARLQGYILPDLKTTEFVSHRFCILSRFFITSIQTPHWAEDIDLIEYSDTLPNLKKLKFYPRDLEFNEDTGRMMWRMPSKITDASLTILTNLTKLSLGDARHITDVGLKILTNLISLDLGDVKNITDNCLKKLTNLTKLALGTCNINVDGIEGLTNLTRLNLEECSAMTDDWLIDSLDKPRFPKLTLLLLPSDDEHQISEDAISILEDCGVTVKENSYSGSSYGALAGPVLK